MAMWHAYLFLSSSLMQRPGMWSVDRCGLIMEGVPGSCGYWFGIQKAGKDVEGWRLAFLDLGLDLNKSLEVGRAAQGCWLGKSQGVNGVHWRETEVSALEGSWALWWVTGNQWCNLFWTYLGPKFGFTILIQKRTIMIHSSNAEKY